MNRKIIFDIETCGCNFDELSESQQEYLLRYAEREKDEESKLSKTEEAIRYLSLYPFTAKVIAIGMLDISSNRSIVYYESSEKEEWTNDEKNTKYISGSEKEIIEIFWKIMEKTNQVITFNGRNFDIPFLMIRSAFHKIKPTRNFLANRYDLRHHIDLLDQFTFYGSLRKFNLDFYCHSFGIESPKSKGVSGIDVKNLYEAGLIKQIAVYCAEDISATQKLYNIWNEFLSFEHQQD